MSTRSQEPLAVPRPGVSFEEAAKLRGEIKTLLARLSGLSEATLRISENLDLDAVLQSVIDGARALTGARYGALLVLDSFGSIEGLITSGITPGEAANIRAEPQGLGLLGYLSKIHAPLRLRNIASHPQSVGFPEGHPPMQTFLGSPVVYRGDRLGNIYLTEKQGSQEFTPEDEETITVFAAHAATAISNARRYRDETRARNDLKGLNERFYRLCEAMRILSQNLDINDVLNGIVTGARALTGAHYGLITTLDESGRLLDFGTSGFTLEERRLMVEMPRGIELLDYYHSLPYTWRTPDATVDVRGLGFDGSLPPFKAALYAPIYYGDTRLGNFYLANREGEGEFTQEDEELMGVFAAQAAVSVANARAYRAEQQAKADLEALIETSPVGVLVFDAKTMRLMSLNQEARRIVRGVRPPGRSRAEMESIMRFRRPDGQEIPQEELPPDRAVRGGVTVRADEVIIVLPDGREVPTVQNATPVFSEAGEVVSVITTMQDMTPLEDLLRQRSEFLGMVSHELRTPLTTIKGATATALASSTAANTLEMLQFFRIIDEQANHMRRLISDLLDATRIDAGTLSLTPEPTDMSMLVETARSMLLRGGARNNIDIQLPLDLPRVNADQQRMLQVLNNLLSNASQYSPDQSTIRVSAAVDGLHVAVSISDEGGGISDQHLTRIFRKFSMLEAGDQGTHEQRNGLGLAICKGIVEAHGGRIWADSDGPGLGARFTFTVPTVDEAVPRATGGLGGAPDDAAAARDLVRILVVDDDPQVLRHIRNTLSQAGYTPIVTANPNEVTRLVQAENPHLILLDLVLPETDGVELMNHVQGIADVPIIFISGYDEDQSVERAFNGGADDYIVKPFSPNELLARIDAVLRRTSALGRTRAREPYVLGDLMIDYGERRVTVAGRAVQLTSTEYNLLSDLSINAGRVLTHDQLLQRVWGPGYAGDSQPVRTFVKNLRNKLGDNARNPTYIFTEPRVGYRMARSEGRDLTGVGNS